MKRILVLFYCLQQPLSSCKIHAYGCYQVKSTQIDNIISNDVSFSHTYARGVSGEWGEDVTLEKCNRTLH